MVTLSPRSLRRRPRLDAVRPLPRLEATPPVTKRCLVEACRDVCDAAANGRLPWLVRCGDPAGPRTIRISADQYSPAQWHKNGAAPCSRRCSHHAGCARLAIRTVPRPILRRSLFVLVCLAEPGQCHRADHGEDEPEHGDTGEPRPRVITEEHDAHDGGWDGLHEDD